MHLAIWSYSMPENVQEWTTVYLPMLTELESKGVCMRNSTKALERNGEKAYLSVVHSDVPIRSAAFIQAQSTATLSCKTRTLPGLSARRARCLDFLIKATRLVRIVCVTIRQSCERAWGCLPVSWYGGAERADKVPNRWELAVHRLFTELDDGALSRASKL